jgi:hypothetical protein
MIGAKDCFVVKAPIDDGFFVLSGDGVVRNRLTRATWVNLAPSILFCVDGFGGNIVLIAKPITEFVQRSLRFSVVVDSEYEPISGAHNWVAFWRQASSYRVPISAAGHISAIDLLIVCQLTGIYLPNCPSEPRNSEGSERSNNSFDGVKEFIDLNQDEWRQAIAGAIFLVGLMIGIAYVVLAGNQ